MFAEISIFLVVPPYRPFRARTASLRRNVCMSPLWEDKFVDNITQHTEQI